MSIRQYNCVNMKTSPFRNVFSDKEFWLILAFNLVLLYTYFIGETSASLIVLMYFIQSVFIGVQYFVRMLILGHRKNPTTGKRLGYKLAFFFMFHYGFFHVVYVVFLISILSKLSGDIDFGLLRWFVLALLGNTILSTVSDVKRDKEGMRVPLLIMFQPYLRIVPMHLLILFGFSRGNDIEGVFLLFIGLKTLADVLLHVIVNQTFKERRPEAVGGFI